MAEIAEFGEFFAETQVNRAGGTVSVFCDNNFRLTFFLGVFVVVLVTVDKHNDIGILL